MTATKIKSYKITKRGERGLVISLPVKIIEAMGLKPSDLLSIYRVEFGGYDSLLLTTARKPFLDSNKGIK